MSRHRNAMMFALALVLTTSAGAWLHVRAAGGRHHRLDLLRNEEQSLRTRLPHYRLQQRVDLIRHQLLNTDTSLEGGMAILLETLATDLRNLNVKDRSLKTSTSTINGPYRQTPLTLSFRAPFSIIFELLKRIGADPGIVRIQRLHIDLDSSATPDELTVSLQLESLVPIAMETP